MTHPPGATPLLPLIIGLTVVVAAGCTGAPDQSTSDTGAEVQSAPSATPAATAEREALRRNKPADQPTHASGMAAPAEPDPCERVSAAAARELEGLRLVGRAGPYRFYGEPRKLLCSEPGAGGVGECEIVGVTTIRVEGGSESYGLRSREDRAAILVYGPQGITCRTPRSR